MRLTAKSQVQVQQTQQAHAVDAHPIWGEPSEIASLARLSAVFVAGRRAKVIVDVVVT